MHRSQMGPVLGFMKVFFFVEKHMKTWAVEFIDVENIHKRIKEFEVNEKIVLWVSSLWNSFFPLTNTVRNVQSDYSLQSFKSSSTHNK